MAPASFALLGAGAVLAAAMQAPLSAVVIVLELTHLLVSGLLFDLLSPLITPSFMLLVLRCDPDFGRGLRNRFEQ